MFKFNLLFFAFLFIIPFNLKAEWVSVNSSESVKTQPKITLISDDLNSTVIKVELSGFNVSEFEVDGEIFHTVDLLTDIFSNEEGNPDVPCIAKVLAVPDQASISVEVLKLGDVKTYKDINLPPARQSWYEGQPETPYIKDIDAYASDDAYPREYASVDPPSIFRDFRIARVSVFPIRYIPNKKELQVVSSITVKINYGSGKVSNPKTIQKKAIAPSFAKLYRSFIFNYQSVLDYYYDGEEAGREVMLCIMDDFFYESFQVYADWKRQIGTDVHVTIFSDIDATSSNPSIIKEHIEDAYTNWEYPPTYVLIVGDNGVFPKKTITYPDYSFANEDYFVEIEGDDHFPEMMIGRFTNQGDYRMQVMINKFMLYEKTPYTGDTDWFKKGICCSNDDYESQVETKRFTANVMLEDGGFTSVDTLMSDGTGWGYNCSMDEDDIVDAIEEGRSYLNYRGEGWNTGWSASCYSFNTSYVSSLANAEKFTFVTSIGCGVAMFDSWGGNCFGEEWVQLGSLSSPRGGIAFIGPTSNTHTTYNNRIDKGIYVGMFQEGMDTPGQALLRGKLYMYNVFGSDSWVEYHYRVFCVLGDPSLHIWKDIPLEVNVEHETEILVGSNQLEFTVTFVDSDEPVANAELCLLSDEYFITSKSDSLGKIYVEITPEAQDTLIVTVRGGNVYPYQSTIEIIHPEEYIQPFGDVSIEDLGGNSDGFINPNENCNLTFTLKNWGSETANNIQATLSSSSTTDIEVISTDPVSFGNIDADNINTGEAFQINVKSSCQVGQIILLQLNVTSNENSWTYDYEVEISGCEIEHKNYIVHDADELDENYRMDPGETVKLVCAIKNIGIDVAPNILGILSCNDPYITISDSIGTFGTLFSDFSGNNSEDYFVVSIEPSCPTEYQVEYSIKYSTQNGLYPYEVEEFFIIPVGMTTTNDYTGPDDYGYYAYSSLDAFYEQTPEYDWFEIDGLGATINVQELSDFTATVSIPFDFKYYGIDYNQVRISTDGWIAFGAGSEATSVNTALPNIDNVNNMAAVFWDDLYNLEIEEGEILYYHDNLNHRFIIEWDSISHNIAENEPIREVFQTILNDPDYYPTLTGDGEIIFQYKIVNQIDSLTVGIENSTQDIGLQYVFNENYDPTASTLINELAIKFTTEPPFFNVVTNESEHYTGYVPVSNTIKLEQNRPNPFSQNTWIYYSLPKDCNVMINIYNVNGQLVKKLHRGKQFAGNYSIMWDGLNDSGNAQNSGVYFYRLQTGNYVKTKKMFKHK